MGLYKDDKVTVKGNSIAKLMGYDVVTGTVFTVNKNSFAMQCNETGALELIDFNDGQIEVAAE
jgi:hypothetical protein